jgi:protein-S-isoprenylcysteine O-methyltransferase Ste14
MNIRTFLFRNRSYTPIPLVIAILYFTSTIYPYIIYGLILIVIGEAIRINAVRYAGGVTRTTNVGAPSLCTSGPYARTRNPLYFGNVIIYSGVVLFSGGPMMVPLLCVVLSFFTFQYYMIISLEEETLKDLFKEKYLQYCENVPRLFPRIISWESDSIIQPSSFASTIKTEKRTLQNIVMIIFLIILRSPSIGIF